MNQLQRLKSIHADMRHNVQRLSRELDKARIDEVFAQKKIEKFEKAMRKSKHLTPCAVCGKNVYVNEILLQPTLGCFIRTYEVRQKIEKGVDLVQCDRCLPANGDTDKFTNECLITLVQKWEGTQKAKKKETHK